MTETFPQILCRLRKERHLNQRTAAAALHISQALLSHYENGLREPGLAFVDAACRYYGVSADYLLGRSSVRTSFPSDELPQALEFLAQSGADSLRAILEGLRDAPEYPAEELSMLLKLTIYEAIRPFDGQEDYTLSEKPAAALCVAARGLLTARLRTRTGGERPKLRIPEKVQRDVENYIAELQRFGL